MNDLVATWQRASGDSIPPSTDRLVAETSGNGRLPARLVRAPRADDARRRVGMRNRRREALGISPSATDMAGFCQLGSTAQFRGQGVQLVGVTGLDQLAADFAGDRQFSRCDAQRFDRQEASRYLPGG